VTESYAFYPPNVPFASLVLSINGKSIYYRKGELDSIQERLKIIRYDMYELYKLCVDALKVSDRAMHRYQPRDFYVTRIYSNQQQHSQNAPDLVDANDDDDDGLANMDADQLLEVIRNQ
jgi:hypothetical protein